MSTEPINSRVYVGGLGEQATVQDVENLLKDYKPYRDLTLLRGFAFVQFHNELAAQAAIKSLNGKVFAGRKLVVKVANDNRAKKGLLPRGHAAPGANPHPAAVIRDGLPLDASEDSFGRSPFGEQPYGVPERSTIYVEPAGPARLIPRAAESNDCEIIVVNKELTAYAENIEACLKRAGMTVDLLFPNNDVPIMKVLTNIASRGSFYAILITPENQERNSITVNVLYGIPAEHRNMPKEDAIMFIINHFTSKKRQEREQYAPIAPFGSVPLAAPPAPFPVAMPIAAPAQEKHPEAIQNMINILAANRALTVLQYEKLIKYLSERKEAQIRVELGEEPDVSSASALVGSSNAATSKSKVDSEKDLERKILDILNKPSILGVPKATASHEHMMSQDPKRAASLPTSHLLHDPKVQRALDSLLQGQFLIKL
ncbi:nuclear receptor coactivator 5 [Anopheles bellator]|uniref:nuclear receptor coactivator 5 n=1 Tax=Anopheles bellator TaxID=139047 RepID=UPI00264A2E38|nr:nuclear receptor coactivator 5 [Anopheles bellator]